ncbi:hypothetical protein E4U41_000559 [Claviceps citrina]|nr:hypothetical protein E4U41_000559 [Claviceps citrina]
MHNNRGRRASSAPWSRLRPVQQDVLESYGLPSKGDTRLLNHKTQESFYARIVDRYMTFCSDAGQGDELLRRFSSLHMADSAGGEEEEEAAVAVKGLSDVLAALRKLREGIVASKRVDDFAAQVYLFCIRISILAKQPESYHPAILYLLRTIHPRHSLTFSESAEVAGYLVLDAVCRRKQPAEAMAICRQYRLQHTKVEAVLYAVIHKNYVVFRRMQRELDGHQVRLMEWADRDIRIHTLKCMGRAYHSVGLAFLETITASDWKSLTRDDDVGWELEEDKVVIRRLKGR